MECSSCGANIDRRDAFCSTCGELTLSGQPLGHKIGLFAAQAADGFGILAKLLFGYVTDEANRNQVIGGAAVVVFAAVVFTSNPISNGVATLFVSAPPPPQILENGQPDFANYEDVFLSEEAEFVVTGTANVRDYPTSQGSRILKSLSEGTVIRARQVQAFDSESPWYRLTEGGYIWSGNLVHIDGLHEEFSDSAGGPSALPAAFNGQWSDRNSCADLGRDMTFSISNGEVDLGYMRYRHVDTSFARGENPIYAFELTMPDEPADVRLILTEDPRWPVLWMSFSDDTTGRQFRYFRAHLSCAEVLSIADRMSR